MRLRKPKTWPKKNPKRSLKSTGWQMSTRLLSLCLILVLSPSLALYGQEERGWTFSGRFRGSTSSAGSVLKLDPTLGYAFNPHVETYAGMPVYFVKQSTTITTTNGFVNGVGNAYAGVRFGMDVPEVNFSSNLVVTAPTGDKDQGFSTGRVTADWTNSFSRRFSSVMPFADIGVANTVSDTSFFVRPFSSLGLVGHIDAGMVMNVAPLIDLGVSGYTVRGAGRTANLQQGSAFVRSWTERQGRFRNEPGNGGNSGHRE